MTPSKNAAIVWLLLAGCGGQVSATEGTEGGSCYPNGTCNEGFTCLSSLCVRSASAGDQRTTGRDGGPLRDGSRTDAPRVGRDGALAVDGVLDGRPLRDQQGGGPADQRVALADQRVVPQDQRVIVVDQQMPTFDMARPADHGQADQQTPTCTRNDQCDDRLGCTSDFCSVTGCIHLLKGGWCLIGGQCYSTGSIDPSNPCLHCDPLASETSFTVVGLGTACDDGNDCTQSDRCDFNGRCAGTPYSCDDSLSCTVDQCDGAGGCDHVIAPQSCLITMIALPGFPAASHCYAAQALDRTDSCLQCDPGRSQTEWTPRTDASCWLGTPCSSDAQCGGSGRCNPEGFCTQTCSGLFPLGQGGSCSSPTGMLASCPGLLGLACEYYCRDTNGKSYVCPRQTSCNASGKCEAL